MTDQTTECNEQAAALPARQLTRARTWTGDTEWYTPPAILEAAHEVLGAIDLDPASSDAQQELSPVKAARYHTVDDSGLDVPWRGRVWLNPPYGRGWIDRFVAKMVQSYQAGDMVAGILLTNSATETKWWRMAAGACDAVCFPTGRVPVSQTAQRRAFAWRLIPLASTHVVLLRPRSVNLRQGLDRFGLVFPKPLGKEGKPI